MNIAEVKHQFTYAGTSHNVFHCNAGEGLPRHEHEYNHATICHAGKLACRKEGKYFELTPDSKPVVLTGKEWHELEALEDGTVFENIFTAGNY